MYNSFARAYDSFLSDDNYENFFNYYKKIFEKFKISPKLVLDLGCGTGRLTEKMNSAGYDMIGIDGSLDMLNIAMERKNDRNILYLNQDITEFELYGTVDVIYSSMDTVNYIKDKNALKRMFKLVKNYLNPNGLFIFDINTIYKFENILNDNTFVYDTDEVYCVWQNSYDKRRKICNFFIDLFYKEKSENYTRFFEEHEERAYKIDELKEIIKGAGLKAEGVFNEFSFNNYNKNSQRVFFIIRRQ